MKHAIICDTIHDCRDLMQLLYEGGCKWQNDEPKNSHEYIHIRHVHHNGDITYLPEISLYKQLEFALKNGFQLITFDKIRSDMGQLPAWKITPLRCVKIGNWSLYPKSSELRPAEPTAQATTRNWRIQ